MNFKGKKILGLMVSCVLAGSLFAGCGGEQQVAKEPQKTVRVGMIANMNANEKAYNEIMEKVEEESGVKLSVPHVYTYYDSMNAMQMGLESKSIDEMSTYKKVAEYIIAHKNNLAVVDHKGMKLKDNFCLALRKDDTALKERLDSALKEMKADGTLDKIKEDFVTNLKPGTEPPAVAIPKTEGADTLKVAVTGDMPPIDLILANGTPAGFNTAVLAELGKRLGMNVELVSLESGARAAALTSKRVDVIFWAVSPVPGDSRPADMDVPGGAALTEPYYEDEIFHVAVKK